MISPTLATSTSSPFLVITLVFSVVIIDVSVVSPLLLSSPFAKAIFEIFPTASSFTFTLNSIETVSLASGLIVHLNEVTVPFSSVNLSALSIVSSYTVPSGIISVTYIFDIFSSLLLVTFNVYVIISPA